MKATKKILVLLLSLYCIGSSIIPAHATEFQPRTATTYNAQASLLINANGQASCSVLVITRSTLYRIEITMSLNQTNGKTLLKSWLLSGTGSLYNTKTYYVTKGYDYQVTADITIRDSSGKLIESFTTFSSIVRY